MKKSLSVLRAEFSRPNRLKRVMRLAIAAYFNPQHEEMCFNRFGQRLNQEYYGDTFQD